MALLDHELPGLDVPNRAVAADRRVVRLHDGVGHGRTAAVPVLKRDGAVIAVLRPVPIKRDADATHYDCAGAA